MNIFGYAVEGDGVVYDFECVFDDDDLDRVAESAAEDYFHNYDGWDYTWPLEFEIFSFTGESLARFSVDLESEPVFCSWEIS